MKNKKTQAILFAAVGIALIVISVLLKQQNYSEWGAIFLNLGLVSVAVVLVEYLWGVSGGNPIESQVLTLSKEVNRLSEAVDIVDASKRVGLNFVYDCQANFGTQSDWEFLIKKAENNIDVMGRTLFGWTRSPELCQLVKRKIVNDGISFRWLLMSSENKYLPLLKEEHINIGAMLSDKITEVQRQLKNILDELPEDKKYLLQVREFKDNPLYCSITRIDEHYFVTPYLSSSGSEGSPMLNIMGTQQPWGQRYMSEFEIIWGSSKDIFDSHSEN